MSTNAVIGYKDEQGSFRGTSLQYDGDLAGEQLNEMLGGDRDSLIRWVEKGIAETGYRDLDETYNDEGEVCFNLNQAKEFAQFGGYIWLINDKGIVVPYGD